MSSDSKLLVGVFEDTSQTKYLDLTDLGKEEAKKRTDGLKASQMESDETVISADAPGPDAPMNEIMAYAKKHVR